MVLPNPLDQKVTKERKKENLPKHHFFGNTSRPRNSTKPIVKNADSLDNLKKVKLLNCASALPNIEENTHSKNVNQSLPHHHRVQCDNSWRNKRESSHQNKNQGGRDKRRDNIPFEDSSVKQVNGKTIKSKATGKRCHVNQTERSDRKATSTFKRRNDTRCSNNGTDNRKDNRSETIDATLQQLMQMNSNEIVFRLQFYKNDINDIVKKVSQCKRSFPVFIEMLFKVCESQFYQNNVTEALTLLLNSAFPQILTKYLASAPLQTTQTVNWTTFFNHLLHIFQKYFRLFPHNASEVFGVALSVAINTVDILTKKMAVDENILLELRDVDASRIENLNKFDKSTQVKVTRDELMHAKQPPNNFRQVATVLCLEDVHQTIDSFLRCNITEGSYNDVEHYLDVQFRLLREDFIAPLREGIIEYTTLMRRKNRKDKKLQELKIYNNVHLCEIDNIPFLGLVYILKFDLSKLKGIKWEQTKRFLNGSLVCLSSDSFQTFHLAVIAKRDPTQLSKGYVGVKLLQIEIFEIDVNENFVMVESPTYFEAYHPVLEGLKNIDENTMPFVNNIVKADKEINPPGYLNRSSHYDLTCIARDEAVRKNCYPLITTSWPSTTDLNLDESQHKALEAALTREIAVIQGPPGTGKTFLGLKIVQVLLNNKDVWSGNEKSPILIVCYTNHALDQFLEEITKFLSNGIVRVGGQSKSEELKALNLNILKKNMQETHTVPNVVHKSIIELRHELSSTALKINTCRAELRKCWTALVPERILFSKGIIPREHYRQLRRLVMLKFKRVATKSTAIEIWLELDGLSFDKKEDVVNADQLQVHNLTENLAIGNSSDQNTDYFYMEDVLAEEEIANCIEDDWMIDDSRFENQEKKFKNSNVLKEVVKGHQDNVGKWEITTDEKKRLKRKMNAELNKSDYMRESEVAKIDNLLALELDDRWRLYRYWINKLEEKKSEELEEKQIKYENGYKQLKEANEYFDKEILKNATIIGMTTTGAAKHRSTLQQVQPAIVIVEEAAEVLETHIVTALSKNCKHLVLIGDQQQLRPNPTVYKLARDYNLDVSLFERLINNGVPYERLTSQHRMRPEIATLLVPHIYHDLRNHRSVDEYENIGGMRKNVFFLNHQNIESSINDSKSKSNTFEAGMIVALARYLLLQGYLPSQITILATYLGQVFVIKQLLKNPNLKDVRCTVVDNFQGEENDIILLSLVRSNDEGVVGFLKVENRVCVALSRARKGLYCVGNLNLLGSKAPTWAPIIKKLLDNNATGHVCESGFPLVCQNHPSATFDAGSVKDFEKAPEGGCLLPCEFRLECGHKCEKICHIIDREHVDIFKCMKPCLKVKCDEGHKCPKVCSSPCNECQTKVEKLSPCGHFNIMPCLMEAKDYCCLQLCKKILPCGHNCQMDCSSLCDVTKCYVSVKVLSPCGHLVEVPCNLLKTGKALMKACAFPCKTVLSCGHICKGSCLDCKQSRIHIPCKEKCGRELVCGHRCNGSCAETCAPCRQKCENRCFHRKCPNICGEPCKPCRKPCAWKCSHKSCSKLCHEMCDRKPCSKPCPVVLKCGHPCIGHCGEPCITKCRVCDKEKFREVFFGDDDKDDSKFVLLEDCNHVVESKEMDIWMNTNGNSNFNMKSCPKCKNVVRNSLRYGNILKTTLKDVVSIKQKIAIEGKTLKDETKILKEVADNIFPRVVMFPLATHLIFNQLENASLTLFDVKVLHNKLNFLLKMSDIWNCYRPTMAFQIVKENVKDLEILLVQLTSETACNDFLQELRRVEFLRNIVVSLQHKILIAKAYDCVQELQSLLTNKQPFTIEQDANVQAKIIHVNQLQTGLDIKNAEKMAVFHTLSFHQGDWFKCSKGHLNTIRNSTGTMVKPKCPQCQKNVANPRFTFDSGFLQYIVNKQLYIHRVAT